MPQRIVDDEPRKAATQVPPARRVRAAIAVSVGALSVGALFAIVMGTACALYRAAPPAPSVSSPGAPAAAEFPDRALDLLTESTTDSCSICAEKHRREAFSELAEAYPPGMILRSTPGRRFLRLAGEECGLALTSYARSQPRLTFRLHVASDHLIGIAESDFTDESIANLLRPLPQGRPFGGALQIIPYQYGDGATFLYSPAGNHLQIQCRIVEIETE